MSLRNEIYEMLILDERTMYVENNLSSMYYQQIDKFIPKIKEKLKEILLNSNTENSANPNNPQNQNTEINVPRNISLNPLVIRIMLKLVFQPYSPYTYLSDEYINEKINTITIDAILNIILQWYSNFKLCNCNIFGLCYNNLSNLNNDIIKIITKKYLVDYFTILKCNDLKLAYLYYIQENRVASIDELIQFENMMYEIENDPEEFHQKYKHKIPTKNISKIFSETMNEQTYTEKQPVCGLCQDDINVPHEYYELPCGHLFHKNEKDCLDNASILNWLKENNVCPICKKEIQL